MIEKIIIFTMLGLLAFSCSNETKESWPNGVNYEVFVLAFADSDGDGKGDLVGLTGKLDYLKETGVGGIWLMPIMTSPSYHKYNVTNYKGIDPDYGSIDDFKMFVAEAHKRNIQVIIDLILNHTGSDHPWFQEAIKGKDNPYRNYYVWAKKDSIAQVIAKKEISLDSDNIRQWHSVKGDSLGEYYYGFFNGGMPDLNFDNQKVKDEFIEIGKFWLNELGVDGFRLDAAKHIYPTDRATDNHAFWVWFRTEMQKIKPDTYLVGEVWSQSQEVAPYLKGLPALFNFDMGYAITAVVKEGRDTIHLVKKYKEINDFYKSVTPDYIDATFLKNHDQNRILSELGDDESMARVAASILFSLPGTPYVYYGEEIGMKGMKPDEFIREPFLWDEGKNDPLQTAWETPKYSNDKTVVPLIKQREDVNSLYNFYKKWITYRNSSEVLTLGELSLPQLDQREVVALIRSRGTEGCLVLHNVSGTAVTVPVSSLEGFGKIDFATDLTTTLSEKEIKLPAYSSVVLKME